MSTRSGGCCNLGRGGRGFGDSEALGPHLGSLNQFWRSWRSGDQGIYRILGRRYAIDIFHCA